MTEFVDTLGPVESDGGEGARRFRAADDSGAAVGDWALAPADAKARATHASQSATEPLELHGAADSDLVVMETKRIE